MTGKMIVHHRKYYTKAAALCFLNLTRGPIKEKTKNQNYRAIFIKI